MTIPPRFTVSVVIPYYNRHEFIDSALASVRAQTARPDECLVVDDCSEPASARLLNECVKRYPELDPRVITLEENGGPGNARNVGAERASGEWIAFLDSDDVWAPHKLEAQGEYLRSRDDCAALHTGTRVDRGAAGSKLFTDKPSPMTLDALYRHSQVTVQSLMIRRSVFRGAGGFDTDMRIFEDYDFSLRLLARGHEIHFLPEPLVTIRRTGHMTLSHPSHWLLALKCMRRLAEKNRELFEERIGRGATRVFLKNHVRRIGARAGGAAGLLIRLGAPLLARL